MAFLALLACLYLLWELFVSEEMLLALRWGVAAVLFFQLVAMFDRYLRCWPPAWLHHAMFHLHICVLIAVAASAF